MKKSNFFLFIVTFILLLPLQTYSQDSLRLYLNAGYVTNIEKCDECKQADQGASIRVGLLTKKCLGFYVGYLFFKEYHPDSGDYDDKGNLIIAGIDYRFLKIDNLHFYAKLGLAYERYISTYRNSSRIEIETSFKPDFGLLLNFKYLNAYLGWQPSDPHHCNIGLGFTMNL